jgi:hypothetical protein
LFRKPELSELCDLFSAEIRPFKSIFSSKRIRFFQTPPEPIVPGQNQERSIPMSDRPKLNTQEAAAYLGVRPNTLEVWRCKHRGPKYAKLGSRIVYDPEELDAFFAARSISTRDTDTCRTGGRK